MPPSGIFGALETAACRCLLEGSSAKRGFPGFRVFGVSGAVRRGRHVFLNVAVYFDVTVATIVCTAGLPSDQDTNW